MGHEPFKTRPGVFGHPLRGSTAFILGDGAVVEWQLFLKVIQENLSLVLSRLLFAGCPIVTISAAEQSADSPAAYNPASHHHGFTEKCPALQ